MSFWHVTELLDEALTSAIEVPDPDAIRRRRLAVRTSGSRRSCGVMDRMDRLGAPEVAAVDGVLRLFRHAAHPGDISITWPSGRIS